MRTVHAKNQKKIRQIQKHLPQERKLGAAKGKLEKNKLRLLKEKKTATSCAYRQRQRHHPPYRGVLSAGSGDMRASYLPYLHWLAVQAQPTFELVRERLPVSACKSDTHRKFSTIPSGLKHFQK